MDLTFAVLGWSPDGPAIELDHREFSYAGKFVMTNTGKAVARANGEVVGAVSFNADRTDDARLWLRYVTVRSDYRGEGIGPRLVAFVRDRALEREYDRIRIAVNNPFAYHALFKAGFGYTGETTGIAELVLEYPADDRAGRYRDGLEEYRGRDLTAAERSFIDERLERGPPERVGDPDEDRASRRDGEVR